MSIRPIDMQVNIQRSPTVNENKLMESHRTNMSSMISSAAMNKKTDSELKKVVKTEKKEENQEYKYDAKEKSNQEYQEQAHKEKKTLKKLDEKEVIRVIKKIDIKI